jgi:hypothetical protein
MSLKLVRIAARKLNHAVELLKYAFIFEFYLKNKSIMTDIDFIKHIALQKDNYQYKFMFI